MINRLTRDVTNNPLWQPGSERRGLGDSGVEEGRVGRFRRMFEGTDAAAAAPTADGAAAPASGSQFAEADLSWMSEGAKEETLSDKQRQGPQKKKGKGKK
ncbi:uncharacterized protein EHS24_009318 [Apiotrichum porosum]|uniref:Uncharacterized protein n=1 Tax=Apiotrichum porosum TaxID=105984 RepID=A0A427XLD5_9TREE|nr:uncharacterized protein EHS24_009318 [Apiotrichum porosum]RSH79666.1 hypothetical protein EHS24_009318 [Apiotrichum porosum]